MTNYIEIAYFRLSGNWDSPKVIHLRWVGLLLICHIWPHVTTHTMPGLLLASLATSWLGSNPTRGYSYMGGRYTRDYIHINTTYYWVQSRSLLFKQGGAGWVISPFGSFHSLHNAQPFSLNTSSETILLILRIYVRSDICHSNCLWSTLAHQSL